MQEMLDWFRDQFVWLIKGIEWPFKWIWKYLLDGVAAALNAIPVPDSITAGLSNLGSLPGGVYWFCQMMALPEGLAMVFSAYAIRFLIRRIPLIG